MNAPSSNADTIAAVATPPGQGGIGVIRLSGPDAFKLARQVAGPLPHPREFAYTQFRDASGAIIDDGLLLRFVAPASFTGEDVVEFQLHGSQQSLAALMQCLCSAGARRARPGEFSERAFHAGKLDLVQAEAIADLIAASSVQAARAARRSLSGVFSQRCEQLHAAMMAVRVQLEASIDFPEDDIDPAADHELLQRCGTIHVEHQALLSDAQRGQRLTEGLRVVLAGAPNVGKSSLLNCLAARDAAIVTAQAGTTRDVMEAPLLLRGVPVTVLDTAGLRDSADLAEQEGVRRAKLAIEQADVVLELCAPDVTDRVGMALAPGAQHLLIYNKCDLGDQPAGPVAGEPDALRISAQRGWGIEALLDRLLGAASPESEFSARRRHIEALLACGRQLEQAQACLAAGQGELAAEELRLAQRHLGEITGQVHSEELLGEIFSGFCIGK